MKMRKILYMLSCLLFFLTFVFIQTRATAQVLFTDTDDDGMPDKWELDNGLNPNNPNDAWLDPDEDQVVNLFEYQLGSGINDPLTPPFTYVTPPGTTYSDVKMAIDNASPGTVIRVFSGNYLVNYSTWTFKKIMIQGGWTDFGQRDPVLYPTIFDGSLKREILSFNISSGEPVIILDSINFVKGGGGMFYKPAIGIYTDGTALMKMSIYNCFITQSWAFFGGVLSMTNWSSSKADQTIANTVIVRNDATGISIDALNSSSAHCRIMNTTICDNISKAGIFSGYGVHAHAPDNGVLSTNIYNSIIWGNQMSDIRCQNKATIKAYNSDICSVLSYDGASYKKVSGVICKSPAFVDSVKLNYRLMDTSPCVNTGMDNHFPPLDIVNNPRPYPIGTKPDMGAYENTTYLAVVSAKIDTYIPNEPKKVELGENLELLVEFTNNGNIDWQFIAGVTVWNSKGNIVAEYEKTLDTTLKTYSQVTVKWIHKVSEFDDYLLQFYVWKSKPLNLNNLLVKDPGLPQKLIICQPKTYNKKLNIGWNLISLPLQPINTSIDAVLSNIMEKCQSVWTYNPDSGWLCYLPNNLQKSNLWNIEAGVGYLLLMKDVKDLTIQGTKPNSSVLLKKGKNLVGYNSQTSMYVVDCMKSISGKYISVYKYDPIKKWQWYAPKMPFNGNLHEMKDGEGYWIEALENCFWDINP